MKKISNGAKWAILFFVLAAVVMGIFAYFDYTTKGSAPGVLVLAGIFLVIALGIYLISRRVDVVPVLLALLLAGASAASCARPAPRRVAIMFPEPVMVTDSAGWTGPLGAVTARR